MTFVDVDGLRIRYHQAGRGTHVLLLHGWGGCLESMVPISQALSSHYRCISIDFPGHGESSLPARPWHVSDFLDITLKLMDRLDVAQTHIVAHSFGGRVSIKMAAAYPQRIHKILFTAGAGVPAPLSLARKLKRTAAHFKFLLPKSAQKRLLPFLASRDYMHAGDLRPTLRNILAEDLTPYLAKIKHPCLLVWGDRDFETPLHCGQVMKRLIVNSELIVFRGAGHFPYLDQPNKFNLLAQRFFRE